MRPEPARSPAEADVVVVGGGPAGLSAALVLGRSRRAVTVVDTGEPRNAPADGVHAFLTRDGLAPAEFVAIARDEVSRYGVEHRSARAVALRRRGERFAVELDTGAVLLARRLVVTTGLVDELPDVPGLLERWGRDVVHCPYCHGWEVRDRRIGVLATSPLSLHQAGLFRQLSDTVVFLPHTSPSPAPDDAATLAARGIEVVEGEVVEVEHADDTLTGVRLADGRRVALEALAVGPRFVGRSQLLDDLGVPTLEHPSGTGLHVPADPMGATEVPGVWVAGNLTDPSAQVIAAAAQGTRVGAAVNADLVAEDTRRARAAAA
ncbi:NAD(P)/FAD-dependent oxidoreductase [Egicoccus halophilus]|uniref:Thioredoxin reductase n=1 Tax=Egicoccus halophilus TaxID=1670830 RepID=A0A8J3EUS5_9ACTN|nr:NAD(P)/FAD-dependent oxidoreductase [Egicoccus halophilus]GGI07780.1 thioredoxin reductase [Egicoccus halophilus]